MPLHQLCASAGSSKTSTLPNNAPIILPSTHAQEIYDVKWKRPMERCSSQTSTLSFSRDICRICHCEADDEMPLITPCFCAGSLRYVHQACLQQWIKSSNTKCCELCKFAFIMQSKVKPFSKWERLDMSGIERKKIICSVAFHAIAVTCVVWSLYVLIQRTSQEVQNGELEWPFWVKLVVVAVGFTGSIVFMYVQCKMYVQLCKRWRAFNRVIYVQNAPGKVSLNEKSQSKFESTRQTRSSPEVEKSFSGVAVIPCSTSLSYPPSTILSCTNSTSSGGGCCTTSSSPPGALWADEPSSPQLGTNPSTFNAGVPHRRGGTLVESETLIPKGEIPSSISSPEYKLAPLEMFRCTSKYKKITHKLGTEVDEELARSFIEPRIIHTANESMQIDLGSDSSDIETLHLDGQ